jgi:predicted RecB family nuclease
VYVLGTPEIPWGDVQIYLDIEGVPDDKFVYLIGMIVCDGASTVSYSFWADSKDQESSLFEQLLAVVCRYSSPRIYVHGGYERAFIERMRRQSTGKKRVDVVQLS